MASKNQVTGKKKTKDKTPKKTQDLLSNQEKNDLAKKIKNLEDENKTLRLENVMFKNNFDLREIIKVFSQKGVTELDGIEMAKDTIKTALQEAENKHSAEKRDMEMKYKTLIEQLSQNLQGADHLPTQSNGASKHNQETDEEIAKYRAHNKELESEVETLKADKEKLNNNIQQLKTEKESLTNKLTTTEELLSKKDNEITDLKKQLANLTTRNQDAISKTVKSDDTDVQLRETTKEKEKAISEKNALLAEIQKLEAEIQKLQNENEEQKNSYEKEKGALLADKQNRDADENKALEQSEEKNKSPNEKNQDTISKAVDLDEIQVLLRETTKEIEKAKSENNDLLAKKQKLEAKIQKLKNENKEQKNSYEKTKDLMEKEKGALLADKQKMDADIKRLQDEIKALKQSEDKNKSLNEKLKKVEETKDNLSQQVQKLQKENNELKYRLKESQSPPLSNVISANDNKTVQQLRDENERLLSRLSELAGAQMTHNNPNIADLSDGFRPTKLSEEYSQLYDNLWTDAFEEHSGKKEEDVIQMLRKGLLGSYKFCEKVCSEFTIQLTNSSLALPNSKPKNGLQDIPIVYKKQLQDMKKSFGAFLRNDVKESYRKQNTIEGGDKTKNYIDACVELCWLMVIQDPPVVIETPASKDSAFDTNTYRAYTTTGTKVDFVVWPALRLHQGGPLLAKGVAQGKN